MSTPRNRAEPLVRPYPKRDKSDKPDCCRMLIGAMNEITEEEEEEAEAKANAKATALAEAMAEAVKNEKDCLSVLTSRFVPLKKPSLRPSPKVDKSYHDKFIARRRSEILSLAGELQHLEAMGLLNKERRDEIHERLAEIMKKTPEDKDEEEGEEEEEEEDEEEEKRTRKKQKKAKAEASG